MIHLIRCRFEVGFGYSNISSQNWANLCLNYIEIFIICIMILEDFPSFLWNFILVCFQEIKKKQDAFRFVVLFCDNFKYTLKDSIK